MASLESISDVKPQKAVIDSLCCRFVRKNLTKICSHASLNAVVCFLVFFGVEHFVDQVSYPQNIRVGFMTLPIVAKDRLNILVMRSVGPSLHVELFMR